MGLFRKRLKQEHKGMLQHDRAAGVLLPEYHRATPECPHPEQWWLFSDSDPDLRGAEGKTARRPAAHPSAARAAQPGAGRAAAGDRGVTHP